MEGKHFRQRGSRYKVPEQQKALSLRNRKKGNVAGRSEKVKARTGAEVRETRSTMRGHRQALGLYSN